MLAVLCQGWLAVTRLSVSALMRVTFSMVKSLNHRLSNMQLVDVLSREVVDLVIKPSQAFWATLSVVRFLPYFLAIREREFAKFGVKS